MTRERVSIKGTSDGVIVTIGSGDWQTILKQLGLKLDQKATFFKGGRVALHVGHRLLNNSEIEKMGDLLSKHQMTLWAIYGDATETQTVAEGLGLETQVTPPSRPTTPTSQAKPQVADNSTTVIRRTLRSGQRVEHTGNIVVLGDVNPGAKITAGGHIIVWGRLRGTVHAGAIYPQDAFVCALQLAPMQLIIGNIISRSPAEDDSNEMVPEMAFVQEGQIVAEAWR